MIAHPAMLDVARPHVQRLAALLATERRARKTRRGRRALTCWWQAVLVLRWLRDGTRVHRLAADHGVSPATAYRYLHEALEVLAAQAPELAEVLADARARGLPHLILDGTLVATDRVATRTEAGNDLWFSGKHRRHGGNVQVLADPAGHPLWVSEVRPGSWHDLACARELALPALHHAAVRGLPVLADKGYIGAGAGVHVPVRRPTGGQVLDPDTRTRNTLLTGLRGLGERAIAALKTRWAALRHVTLDPARITQITAAALVLHQWENEHHY